MTDIRFTDSLLVDNATFRTTSQGYLVGSAKVARTGIQEYRRAEMGLTGDGVVRVYRPESAVFDKDSMATYAGKPVTLTHPPAAVTAENWKDYAVGHVGNEVTRDGETIKVPFVLMDANAIQAVQNGTREISMGYTTPVAMQDGVTPSGEAYNAVQTGPIKINHLAIVPQARGGSELRIGDSAKPWGVSPVTSTKGNTMNKIVFDGLTIEVNDQAREVIQKLQSQLADSQAETAKKDAALAAKDTEIAKKDADLTAKASELEAAKKAIPAGPTLDALVAERQTIVDTAKAVKPDFVADGKSNAAIKQELVADALTKAVVDAKLEGKSDAYREAFFDATFDHLAASHAPETTTQRVVATLRTVDAEAGSDKALNDAYNATLTRFDRKAKA